jgi:hypothetical protein
MYFSVNCTLRVINYIVNVNYQDEGRPFICSTINLCCCELLRIGLLDFGQASRRQADLQDRLSFVGINARIAHRPKSGQSEASKKTSLSVALFVPWRDKFELWKIGKLFGDEVGPKN